MLSYSLLFFIGGLLMIPSYGLLGLWISGAGALGLLIVTGAWLFGALTGRFPAISVGCYPAARARQRPARDIR